MVKKYNVAIAGATGAVGREFLNILEERNFPIDKLYLLASENSKGKKILFNNKEYFVEELSKFDFKKVHLSLFSPGGSVSAEFAPKAAQEGSLVIDNTSFFRMKDDVPLIVPEVNADVLENFFENKNRSNIIANPNCSTIQMVVALKPLHDEAIINRIVVSTYQAVSGAGKTAMDELFNQTQGIYANKTLEKNKFTKQIAFNAIPHIGPFVDNGNTEEEQKMINETKKILDQNIEISATCVRIPVFIGHSESVNIEFDSFISPEKTSELLRNFKNISIVDLRQDEGYVTPVEVAGEDKVYISRIRRDYSTDNGINMWIVADNLRKGAALNAIQIAEIVIEKFHQHLNHN